MIKLRVPATTANLGVGFDCLGLALNLYNEYLVEDSDSPVLINVEERFDNPENLFVQSYHKLCNSWPKAEFSRIDVPVSRGLGSSSTLYTAGAAAAALLHRGTYTSEDIFAAAAALEGHPDNAAPCFYGGLIGCLQKEDGSYIQQSFPLHASYRFTVLIPDHEVSTEQARAILPDVYDRHTTVSGSAKLVFFLQALATGDLSLLKEAGQDQIHEPYRKTLIPHYDEIRTICEEDSEGLFLISGSGSTCLLISKQPLSSDAEKKISAYPEHWQIKEVLPAYNGAEVEQDGTWVPIKDLL